MEAFVLAVLHAVPVITIGLIAETGAAIIAVSLFMCIVAVFAGNPAFAILDLLAVGLAAAWTLNRVGEKQEVEERKRSAPRRTNDVPPSEESSFRLASIPQEKDVANIPVPSVESRSPKVEDDTEKLRAEVRTDNADYYKRLTVELLADKKELSNEITQLRARIGELNSGTSPLALLQELKDQRENFAAERARNLKLTEEVVSLKNRVEELELARAATSSTDTAELRAEFFRRVRELREKQDELRRSNLQLIEENESLREELAELMDAVDDMMPSYGEELADSDQAAEVMPFPEEFPPEALDDTHARVVNVIRIRSC